MTEPLIFLATIEKVQQMPRDNAIRIWLDLPESALYEMARFAEFKLSAKVLRMTAEPEETFTDLCDETKKGTEGSGSKVDRRRLTNG